MELNQQQIEAVKFRDGYGFVTAVPGSGKCIAGDSLILSPVREKMFEIKNNSNSCVYSNSSENFERFSIEQKEISEFYCDGERDVITIESDSGLKITGTHCHPIAVLDSDGKFCWKKLSEIKEGMYCPIFSVKNYEATSSFDNEFYVAGTLCGYEKGSSECGEKSIPNEILMGSDSSIGSFIRGIFDANGCVEKGGIEIYISSKILADQLQVLMLRYGVFSSKKAKETKGVKSYRLRIDGEDARRFKDNIGFALNYVKNQNLIRACEKKSNLDKAIPNFNIFLRNIRDEIALNNTSNYDKNSNTICNSDISFCFSKYLRKNIKNRRNITERSLSKLLNILQSTTHQRFLRHEKEYISAILSNYSFSQIVKKTYEKEKILVYDYVVPVSHNFIANGFVNHNTRVLTERTVELINSGVSPQNILCITFTNKAAREMKERIEKRVKEDVATKLWVSTFHSMGAKILRKEVDKVPHYTSDFTIIDPDDQKTVIERGIEALDLVAKGKGKKKNAGIDVWNVVSMIGAKKDKLQNDADFKEEHDPQTCQLFDFYKEYLIKSNCMDFGDLLYILYLLLLHKKSVTKKYATRFKYIMVDECQDLNFCQYEIVKMLSSVHKNLVLIGDCDQSIYRFRQADPKNVTKYLGEKDVKQLPLSYNYRSTGHIIRSAEAVIKNNSSRVSGKLETVNENGEFAESVKFNNHLNESRWVAQKIRELRGSSKYDYSDFAILYRTNAMSRLFEQDLRMNRIPCKVIGGKSFFDLVVVKICINYLQFYLNPNNVLAFHKVINRPRRSIATEITNTIEKYCFDNKCTILEALENIDSIDIERIGNKRRCALSDFYSLMKRQEEVDGPIYPIAERIFRDSGLVEHFEEMSHARSDKEKKEGRSSATDTFASLMSMLKEWDEQNGGNLRLFLEYINLQTSNDQVDESNCVKLMTMHTSKGLEFPVVFIVAAEDGFMPHKFSLDTHDPEDLEEERRLFYVAMTRAKKNLYITYSLSRMLYGSTERKYPSRFLGEAKRSGSILEIAGDNEQVR